MPAARPKRPARKKPTGNPQKQMRWSPAELAQVEAVRDRYGLQTFSAAVKFAVANVARNGLAGPPEKNPKDPGQGG